jgi:hypothetical protein
VHHRGAAQYGRGLGLVLTRTDLYRGPHVRPKFARTASEQQMSDTWLTYAQAGERFGLTPDAMRMRARRLGWRTQPGNDGRTLILVPADALIEPRSRPPKGLPKRAAGGLVEQTEQLGRMLDLFEAADARADRAESRAEQAETRAERAEHRAEQAEQRADRAEEERTTAQALADHAQAQLVDATARADRLRDNLDSTHADMVTAERRAKEAEDRARQAHAEAQAALRAAATLRQADAARRAKGRLHRILAAWRGDG